MERGSLVGADAKLAWAGAELEALNQAVVSWGSDRKNGYDTSSDFYASEDVRVLAMRAHFATPPPEFSVIAGNIIHCCRCALDYLVSDLAVLNGNEPVNGPGGNQFPIFRERPRSRKGNPVDFVTKTSGSLQGLRKGHVRMIERLQPYRRNNRIKGASNSLELLADLSNTDKHRVLHVLSMGLVRGRRIEIHAIPEKDVAEVLDVHAIMVGPHLKSGAVIAAAEIVPAGRHPKMYAETLIPSQLVLEDAIPLMPALGVIYDTVAHIIDWFRPIFSGEKVEPYHGVTKVPFND